MTASLLCLPDEVLSGIVDRCRPLRHKLRLRLVNRRLNQLLLAHPSSWASTKQLRLLVSTSWQEGRSEPELRVQAVLPDNQSASGSVNLISMLIGGGLSCATELSLHSTCYHKRKLFSGTAVQSNRDNQPNKQSQPTFTADSLAAWLHDRVRCVRKLVYEPAGCSCAHWHRLGHELLKAYGPQLTSVSDLSTYHLPHATAALGANLQLLLHSPAPLSHLRIGCDHSTATQPLIDTFVELIERHDRLCSVSLSHTLPASQLGAVLTACGTGKHLSQLRLSLSHIQPTRLLFATKTLPRLEWLSLTFTRMYGSQRTDTFDVNAAFFDDVFGCCTNLKALSVHLPYAHLKPSTVLRTLNQCAESLNNGNAAFSKNFRRLEIGCLAAPVETVRRQLAHAQAPPTDDEPPPRHFVHNDVIQRHFFCLVGLTNRRVIRFDLCDIGHFW